MEKCCEKRERRNMRRFCGKLFIFFCMVSWNILFLWFIESGLLSEV